MDEQLKKLQPPIRTAMQITNSKRHIQKKIEERSQSSSWQYYGTIVAACALLLFLGITYFSTPTSLDPTSAEAGTDIQTIYKFKNYNTEPIFNIDTWYYTGKTKITNKEQVDFIEKYALRLQKSGTIIKKDWPEAMTDYLIVYTDGLKQYLQFYSLAMEDGVHIFLRDAVTNQIIDLNSNPDVEKFMDIANAKKSFANTAFKFLLCFVLLILIAKLFHRLRITMAQKKRSGLKIMLFGMLAYFYFNLFKGISYYLFGTEQGIFMLLLVLPIAIYRIQQYSKTKDRGYLNEILMIFILVALAVFVIGL